MWTTLYIEGLCVGRENEEPGRMRWTGSCMNKNEAECNKLVPECMWKPAAAWYTPTTTTSTTTTATTTTRESLSARLDRIEKKSKSQTYQHV